MKVVTHPMGRLLGLGLFLLLSVPGALAQLPGLPGLTEGALQAQEPASSAGAPSSAEVTFNNRTLFRIYAADQARATERADLVNLRLDRALRELAVRRSSPRVTERMMGQDAVILMDGLPLLTVTGADTSATGTEARQLAGDWATEIERALATALREQQPGFWREAAMQAALIVVVGILLHLAIWFFATKLFARPGWPVLLLVWIGVVSRILDLLPQTRPLRNLLRAGVFRPVFICVIVALAAAALSRGLGLVLRHFFPPLPDTLSPEERTERTFGRRATLGEVARVTGVATIWIIAAVVALSWSGVNLPALLASAGLIGVALGLAAQDSMKDLVAGINILVDDRFGVGDVIQVGEYSGRVENLNLRVTQVRDLSGGLITFPNRNIETVANLTSRWAQVDFKVGVAYETDLRAAMRSLEDTAQGLADDWSQRVLAPPELLGADSYNDSAITLRMLLRTAPGDQWAVARELRVRVKEAFDAAGIAIPFPQRTLRFVKDTGPAAEEERSGAAAGSEAAGAKES
jgi:moderate conductance mechanosensitive channel